MLHSKEGPNQPGPIFSTIYILFHAIFLLINYSLLDHYYILPEFFRNSHLRPTFCDPPFATPNHNPHFATHLLRPPLATHVSRPTFRNSTRDSHSRLTFATLVATHIPDSRSRLHSRLTFATPDRAPNCDSIFFCLDFRRVTPPLMDGLC